MRIKVIFLSSIDHPQIILEAMEIKKVHHINTKVIFVQKKNIFNIDTLVNGVCLECIADRIIQKLAPLNKIKLFMKIFLYKSIYIPKLIQTLIFVYKPKILIKYLFYLSILDVLLKNEYNEKIDEKIVIYSHWAYPAGLLAIWTKSIYNNPRNVKIIVSLWGYDIQRTNRFKYGIRGIYNSILNLVLRKSDLIIVNHLSHMFIVRNILNKKYWKKIIYIPPGIPDLSKVEIKDNEKIIYKVLSTRCNMEKIVLYAPSLKRIYGIKEFLKAIPIVLRHIPDVCFIIVGSGELLDYTKKFVRDNNLDKNIIILGKIKYNIMITLYKIAKVVCDLAYTGPGTTSLEALVFGKPIIAINSIKKIIIHNFNGFLIKKGEYDRLAEYIISLLSDNNLYNRISRNARTSFLKYYHIKERIKLLADIIRNV